MMFGDRLVTKLKQELSKVLIEELDRRFVLLENKIKTDLDSKDKKVEKIIKDYIDERLNEILRGRDD